jgi:hypothetical protein
MDTIQTITLIALGALLGTIGQAIRAVVGIKKEIDAANQAKAAGMQVPDWFNGKELGVSLLIGALAGSLAAILQYGKDLEITKDLLFGLVGAGYAGADFIGGVMQKWLPKT